MQELLNTQREELVDFILKRCEPTDSIVATSIPSLRLYIATSKTQFISTVYEPSLCLALQGSKEVGFGDSMKSYNESRYLLVSTNIPASVRVEEASKEKPYVSLKIVFTLEQIYEVLKEIESNDVKKRHSLDAGLFFDDLSMELLNPISRLVKLLDTPKKNIDFMAPLIIKEILYILLNGQSGEFLKEYVRKGSRSNQMVQVISEIKDNFAEALNMKEMAEKFNISESTLYHNFKKITMLSPLQFQKKLRLEEATNILLNQNIDAHEVAFKVGYESASQFSREYSRMYGLPPKAHVSYLKEKFPAQKIG